MKFPGKRKKKHYFPVNERGRIPFETFPNNQKRVYITGIDQMIVDVEAHVSDEDLIRLDLKKGQSQVLDDEKVAVVYEELKNLGAIKGEYAGGTVGNTLHNYSLLSDDKAVAFGCMARNITIGDYAYKYLCNTSAHVDLSYLQPIDRPMGRGICFVTPDGERTFAISAGGMNDLTPQYINEEIIENSAALLMSAYLFRDSDLPMYRAAMHATELAKKHDVPVVLSLGTSGLVESIREFLLEFIEDHVSILAMNQDEAKALINIDDPLKAGKELLKITDMTVITVGAKGLYMCGHVDEELARETKDELHTKSVREYNKYEYSRVMRKQDCRKPIRIYAHINPFLGGPEKIYNTNGAGDGALAAILHDISANKYHQAVVPNSSKHKSKFLTYSSLAQICKYANRVSYEVLAQNSPRLSRGLPESLDELEETYWER